MRKKIIFIGIILALVVAAYAYNEYTRKPATAKQLPTDYTLTAEALMNEFANEEAATKKYENKTIEVSGVIETVAKNEKSYDVSLATSDPMTLITVQLIPEENEAAQKLKAGDKIKLKGICNGKLSDIELNKGAIVK
jgi:tRNA_anti-like